MKRVLILFAVFSIAGTAFANVIINGDFEAGNTGFYSEYTYVAPPLAHNDMGPPETYTVDTDPYNGHSAWASYGDHTSGSGNMLIVNATYPPLDPAPFDTVVWGQDVSVIPGRDYEFSYWVSLCHPTNPPLLQLSINGVEVGVYDANAVGGAGVWVQVTHMWNSGANNTATIEFVDLRPVYSGDDYAIDDISMTAVAITVDLCAGQTMDAGDVVVWNDGCDLYVQFQAHSGWEMNETHPHVALDVSDIPQTKKGNPIPGQFDYKREYDPRLTEDLYVISLTGGDATYYIAAHAVLLDTSSIASGNEAFQSGPGVDVYGPLAAYLPLGDSGWGDPIPAVATWVHSAWPSIPGATWISTSYLIGELGGPIAPDSWRWFHEEFELPYTAFNISGTATATSDNAEDVYLNGGLVGSDGEVQGAFVDNHEWATVLDYDLSSDLQPGMNQLDFIVRNYAGSSSPYSNPTGLIYDVSVDFDYYDQEETAWGDGCEGTSFPGKNWGTYFTFDVVGCD